jgi:dynactin 1
MSDPNLRPGAVIELNDGRLGTIRFVGETAFRPGRWIGVELEDATGKNDGSVQGKRYFDCDPGYGMFLQWTGVARIVEAPPPKPAPVAARPNGKAIAAAPKGRQSSIVSETSRTRPASRPSSIASDSRGPPSGTSVRDMCVDLGSYSLTENSPLLSA